mmetsp:Transcript_11293/g.47229  ORF Transcript_11293/g.47229 Transcript_11293/m.47229 type:complete len:307 (-) Transcript_11293:384-1304(-)
MPRSTRTLRISRRARIMPRRKRRRRTREATGTFAADPRKRPTLPTRRTTSGAREAAEEEAAAGAATGTGTRVTCAVVPKTPSMIRVRITSDGETTTAERTTATTSDLESRRMSAAAAAAATSTGSVNFPSTTFLAASTSCFAPSTSGGPARSAHRAAPAYALALAPGGGGGSDPKTAPNARLAGSTSPAWSAANAASTATSAFIPRESDGSSPCSAARVPAPAAAVSIALSTNASSWSSGKTPWKVSTNRPSIIVITVGSVWIRSWSLMPVWVSTSTFTNTHLPPDRVANCSSLGVSFLHGWHQSA